MARHRRRQDRLRVAAVIVGTLSLLAIGILLGVLMEIEATRG